MTKLRLYIKLEDAVVLAQFLSDTVVRQGMTDIERTATSDFTLRLHKAVEQAKADAFIRDKLK